jgi:molecular chaperone GrpE (heat shock protein)
MSSTHSNPTQNIESWDFVSSTDENFEFAPCSDSEVVFTPATESTADTTYYEADDESESCIESEAEIPSQASASPKLNSAYQVIANISPQPNPHHATKAAFEKLSQAVANMPPQPNHHHTPSPTIEDILASPMISEMITGAVTAQSNSFQSELDEALGKLYWNDIPSHRLRLAQLRETQEDFREKQEELAQKQDEFEIFKGNQEDLELLDHFPRLLDCHEKLTKKHAKLAKRVQDVDSATLDTFEKVVRDFNKLEKKHQTLEKSYHETLEWLHEHEKNYEADRKDEMTCRVIMLGAILVAMVVYLVSR